MTKAEKNMFSTHIFWLILFMLELIMFLHDE
jgi:hypothetical protein